jgi:predicted ArsR family transcriptional regulator
MSRIVDEGLRHVQHERPKDHSLRAELTLTHKLLAQRLSISENGVKYHLNKLKAAGRIRHVGPTKAGRWEVIEDRLDASGDGRVGGGDE